MNISKNALYVIALPVITVVAVLGLGAIQAAITSVSIQTSDIIASENNACSVTSGEGDYIEFGGQCIQEPQSVITEKGWVNPIIGVNVGHSGAPSTDQLTPFTEAGSSNGVIIDQAFINANKNKPWYSFEDGRDVIDGIFVEDSCLNISVEGLILRNSYVNCPVRKQENPSAWGYFGTTENTPAILARAENILIEKNTITCSGFDFDICSRGVEAAAIGVEVRYNDISGGRGAVQLFRNTTFEYNYAHSFSFGGDPGRIGNTASNSSAPDEITHNNVTNNQGYEDTLVKGNYIDARYGRVSQEPNRFKNPHFPRVYGDDLIPEVGDPINGYTFTNYLNVGTGAGNRIVDNFVINSGRPFLCNSSSNHSSSVCLEEFSGNAFVDDAFDEFNLTPLLEDAQDKGALRNISCNYFFDNDVVTFIPQSDLVRSGISHNVNNCGV